MDHTTYKGIDLLNKVLEFMAMTPNEQEWNLKSLAYNPPRQIRLRQIGALLKAFCVSDGVDLRAGIRSVLTGDFLNGKDPEAFTELVDFVNRFMKKTEPGEETLKSLRPSELRFIYPKMIDYKIKLRQLLGFNSGWMESSSVFARFHISLTNSISANLKDKSGDLDRAIELLINPKKLAFTEAELIAKFNYPSDNLRQVDMDNW